jgi:hypothetical protein
MNTFLERTAALLNRRFLLNAFLPVLVIGSGTVAVCLFQAGVLGKLATAWAQLSGAEQLSLAAGWLATIWFLAGFLASQFRALTQMFEGYPLMRRRWLRRFTEYLIGQHKRRWGILAVADPEQVVRNYPIKQENFMPTRLGRYTTGRRVLPV